MSQSITFKSYETHMEFWTYPEGQKWDSINIDKDRATGIVTAIEDAFGRQKSGCFAMRDDTKFTIERERFWRYHLQVEQIVRGPQILRGQATLSWSATLWSWQVWHLYKTLKSLAA